MGKKAFTIWGPWQTEGSGGENDPRWQHRYIEAITVDGVRYTVNNTGDMVSPTGLVIDNAGRGEARDYRRADTVRAVFARDGVDCDGEPHRLDAEDECRQAIRAATVADE